MNHPHLSVDEAGRNMSRKCSINKHQEREKVANKIHGKTSLFVWRCASIRALLISRATGVVGGIKSPPKDLRRVLSLLAICGGN